MIDISKSIWYKDISIDYDDYGFYTVPYCGDDVVFDTAEDAKKFIDENYEDDRLGW